MNHKIKEEEIEILKKKCLLLEEQCKLLIQTEKRLYTVQERLDREITYLHKLQELNFVLTSTYDIQELLDHTVYFLVNEMFYEKSMIFIRQNQKFVPQALAGLKKEETEKIKKAAFHEDSFPIDLLINHPKALLFDDKFYQDEKLRNSFEKRFFLESFLYAPLHDKEGNINGIIISGNSKERAIFFPKITEDDVGIYSALANQLSLVIENQDRSNQLNSLNTELKKINEELKQANETKANFLGMMSHELRTPLNSIVGFSSLASKNIHHKNMQIFIDEIKQNGELLLVLINDLLDFTKLEAGEFELFFENINIAKIIQEVASSSMILTENKQITIKTILPKDPTLAFGDPMRIKQILFNLTSNACKFTNKGAITITCELLTKNLLLPFDVPQPFYHRTHCITIADTGKGIAEKNLHLVFEPFKQLDSSETRTKGTGLGLPITKKLVELHETKVYLTSKEKFGTTVYFFIPASEKDFHELKKNKINDQF